jgi:hypothetical protein
VTDIAKRKKKTIEDVRKECEGRNDFMVDLSMQKFIYRGYSTNMMEFEEVERKVEFHKLIEEFAYFYRHNLMYMFTYTYERFLCSHLVEDYAEMATFPELYEKYFDVVKGMSLTFRLYDKDILYVFEDDFILIVKDKNVAKRFRELRGLE